MSEQPARFMGLNNGWADGQPATFCLWSEDAQRHPAHPRLFVRGREFPALDEFMPETGGFILLEAEL